MVVNNNYYVIGIREKGTDVTYYFKERADSCFVFVEDVSCATKTKMLSTANEIVD